jgi:organic hydroperoxide reductase OsmC/OhrA
MPESRPSTVGARRVIGQRDAHLANPQAGRHTVPVTVISAQFRSLAGTEASVGTAGDMSVVVDRPEGRAGGQGLGFNGGQLLALAVGGCLCNDLRYAAHEVGTTPGDFEMSVDVQIDDTGMVGQIQVRVTALGDNLEQLGSFLQDAVAESTVANAITAPIPVNVTVSD